MQIFLVQGFLSKQDLWKDPIDGIYSDKLDSIIDKYIEANGFKFKDKTAEQKLLIVEQLIYKQEGLLDKVSEEDNETFQKARSTHALNMINKSKELTLPKLPEIYTFSSPKVEKKPEPVKETSSNKKKKKRK